MQTFLKFLFVVLILAFGESLAKAQPGWELGGWGGVAYYFGDLNTEFILKRPGSLVGMTTRYNFNERVCWRLSAGFTEVSAYDSDSDNPYQQARNLHFRSPIADLTMALEFNFLSYTHGSKDEFFTPYVLGGFSIFYYNPQAQYQGEWVDLRPLGTEGQFKGEEYYSLSPALVYGVGMKFSLNYVWGLEIEIGGRHAFTDYLDDVSTVYPDRTDLEKLRGEVAVALSDPSIDIPGVDEQFGREGFQRGDSNSKDNYVFVSVGLSYYFGHLLCPSIGRH